MKPKVLPIDIEPMEMKVMGINMIPIIGKVFNMMPKNMRKKTICKFNAPNPDTNPRDLHDVTGENPYETEEIVEGKVWLVKYTQENTGMTDEKEKKAGKMMGMDPMSEVWETKCLAGAASHGPEAVEICKKDIKTAREWHTKTTFTNEELKKACNNKSNMIVIKMNSGGLMLYNPVRVREEHGFKAWLEGLGKVEWILIGSCYHTKFLPITFKMYPEAKIVGTETAWEKMKIINVLPRNLQKFDVNAGDPEQLKAFNIEMEKEDVKLFYVDGDKCTNAVCAITNNILLTADLLYGSHDGDGFFGLSKQEWLDLPDEAYGYRIFRFLNMSKPNSPNGTLATYRFHMMNPKSIGAMMYDPAASDGSSCKVMADSLRKLLRQENYETAICVHAGKMTRDIFRKDIDANWNWLDGASLLI